MKKFGLIGQTLSYSYSPTIHREVFAGQNIQASYDLLEVDPSVFLETIPGILRSYQGLNVTIPYKNQIIPLLDALDPLSRSIGAVNTVKNQDGFFVGYNTDAHGFLETLERYRVPVKGSRYLILGTGGAAKSVYYALQTLPVESVAFVSRHPESDWIKDEKIWTYDTLVPDRGDVIVNTTPLGMTSKEARSPLDSRFLDGATHVVDLIYNPRKTPLLQDGESLGLAVVNGLYMLVSQAIRSEEIWNDITVSAEEKERIFSLVEDMMYN